MKSFCGKKDAFDRAGIRAQVFQLPLLIIFYKKFETKKNNAFNKFYFYPDFFLIASSLIFPNDAILINHGSFFQGKDSLQHVCFQFLKINSLMAETIKKQNFYKQIPEFDKNSFFFKNWKPSNCGESFS